MIETMSVPGSDDSKPRNGSADDGSIADVVEYVKAYAEQQTVGPIKGAGRFLAYGCGLALDPTQWSRIARGGESGQVHTRAAV